MIRASEEAEDKSRAVAESKRRHIPPLPDLRFEYSYLRGVAQYVRLERPHSQTAAPSTTSENGKETEKAAEAGEDGLEDVQLSGGVHVQWGRVLWITTRDQVLSPLLQGAAWGVASHFLRPFGALLGAHIRAWWGNGVQWLRSRMGGILTPTPAANNTFHR
ncbi:hypothetical protein C8Q80DRAFT_1339530 [Daedaleopsis nitida]|nr:hypothetical protein C8Q80DRAFT_1339530 [Daedaleopsis nitida]